LSGGQDLRTLDRFSLRKTYAVALTKKKEVLYWGDLLEHKGDDHP